MSRQEVMGLAGIVPWLLGVVFMGCCGPSGEIKITRAADPPYGRKVQIPERPAQVPLGEVGGERARLTKHGIYLDADATDIRRLLGSDGNRWYTLRRGETHFLCT